MLIIVIINVNDLDLDSVIQCLYLINNLQESLINLFIYLIWDLGLCAGIQIEPSILDQAWVGAWGFAVPPLLFVCVSSFRTIPLRNNIITTLSGILSVTRVKTPKGSCS